MPVLTSDNGEGFIGRETGVRTVFVHENFSGEFLAAHVCATNCREKLFFRLFLRSFLSHDIVSSGELFDHLVGVGSHILGPPAIRGLRARGEPLLVKRSPVFCLQVLLFTLQDNSLVLISI